MDEDITRRAYQNLISDKNQVINIWKKRNIGDSKIKEHWGNWMCLCNFWIYKVYPYASRAVIPHRRLLDDLFRS